MEINWLENTVYVDPLTGLPNFLKFIDSNFSEVFSTFGIILIFDIGGMVKINEKYGRNIGDLCLSSLSSSINSVLSSLTDFFIFRTGGDEFIAVLPKLTLDELGDMPFTISSRHKELMEENGLYEHEVHMLVQCYDTKIDSIESFYELLLNECNKNLNDKHGKFSKDKLLRNILSNITGRIRETVASYNDAYHLALTDDISGLPNQRAGKLYLSNLLNDYKIYSTGFSILFIDGDNLKRYNKISYRTGNDMIKKLSDILVNSVRSCDKVYRWLSGDEFLIILENTNPYNTLRLAERVRAAVEEQSKEWVYPITISIGIANYPEDGFSIDEIIDKAEKANSLAKMTGKNKVVKWEGVLI
jgi:diguanylate cyclase (GGDEF)-like protein